MDNPVVKRKKSLDFRRPIATRCGYEVRLYDIYEGRYINFGYYDPDVDVWWPRQCNWDGSDTQGEWVLGLHNVK